MPRTRGRFVFEELVSMLSPAKKPFKPEKGKTNIVMFVGLQAPRGEPGTHPCVQVRSGYRF